MQIATLPYNRLYSCWDQKKKTFYLRVESLKGINGKKVYLMCNEKSYVVFPFPIFASFLLYLPVDILLLLLTCVSIVIHCCLLPLSSSAVSC